MTIKVLYRFEFLFYKKQRRKGTVKGTIRWLSNNDFCSTKESVRLCSISIKSIFLIDVYCYIQQYLSLGFTQISPQQAILCFHPHLTVNIMKENNFKNLFSLGHKPERHSCLPALIGITNKYYYILKSCQSISVFFLASEWEYMLFMFDFRLRKYYWNNLDDTS